MADPKSCTNPGSVNAMLRTAPPGVDCASNTSTCNPAWASTMAAAKPFGPDPTTHALGLFGTILSENTDQCAQGSLNFYSLGCTSGHSTTLISPSGVLSIVGA